MRNSIGFDSFNKIKMIRVRNILSQQQKKIMHSKVQEKNIFKSKMSYHFSIIFIAQNFY